MMIENQFSICVQVFRSDNGKEYMSQAVDDYFTKITSFIKYHAAIPHLKIG